MSQYKKIVELVNKYYPTIEITSFNYNKPIKLNSVIDEERLQDLLNNDLEIIPTYGVYTKMIEDYAIHFNYDYLEEGNYIHELNISTYDSLLENIKGNNLIITMLEEYIPISETIKNNFKHIKVISDRDIKGFKKINEWVYVINEYQKYNKILRRE